MTIFQTRTAASKEDQGTGGAPLTALTGAGRTIHTHARTHARRESDT